MYTVLRQALHVGGVCVAEGGGGGKAGEHHPCLTDTIFEFHKTLGSIWTRLVSLGLINQSTKSIDQPINQ